MLYIPYLEENKDWPEEVRKYIPIWDGDKWSDADNEHGIHAALMYDLCIRLNAQVVLELGTRHGKSARIFIEAMKKTGGHVWSIDDDSYDLRSIEVPDFDKDYITLITSDDMKVEWDKPINLLFIDSSHEYEHSMNQMDKFWPYVTTPGMMIQADCDSHFSEKRAVQDWAEKMRMGYILDTRNQGVAVFSKPAHTMRYRDKDVAHEWIRKT